MNTEIMVAIIGSCASLVVAVVSIVMNNRVLSYKMDELTKDFNELKADVKKHNQLVERLAVVERDLKTAFNRTDELRTEIRELRREVNK